MAPEVFRGQGPDSRSDVWAFGVLLCEMITGRHPFTGPSPFDVAASVLSDAPVTMPTGVPPPLAVVIGKCLARSPARRYRQAGEVRAALEACHPTSAVEVVDGAAGDRVRRRVPVLIAAIVAAAAVAIAGNIAGLRDRLTPMLSEPAIAFAERDWLLVADFDNQTGDPSFDRALNTALQAAIGQSRYVNLVPAVRVRESLRRMQRSDAPRVDESMGREIAQREGIGMVLHPAIASAGGAYVLTAALIDPASGVTLRSRTARAQGREGVLEAVDRLSIDVRRDLGEAAGTVAQSKPLARVTTASFEALRLFTLGREAHTAQQIDKARELYAEALRLDPSFTAARASLGMINVEFFDRRLGEDLLTQAIKGIDGLTENEQMNVLAFHAQAVERNFERAAEHYRKYLAVRPDAAAARNNLGRVYMFQGRLDLAVAELREALRLEPDLMLAYFSLASIYLHRLADFDAAIDVSRRQLARNERSPRAYGQLAAAYLGKGDLRQAEDAVRRALELDSRFTLDWLRLGQILRMQNRHAEALQAFQQALQVGPDDGTAHYHAAVVAGLLGDRASERQHLRAGVAATETALERTPDDARLALRRAAFLARMGDARRAAALAGDSRSAEAEPVEHAAVLCLLRRYDAAIAALQRAHARGFRDVPIVRAHPDLEALNGRPGFEALIAAMMRGPV
jgi:tetratricopeptide (TPR) repeat protein